MGSPEEEGRYFHNFYCVQSSGKYTTLRALHIQYCEVENIVKVSDVDQIIGYGH